MRRVTLVLVLAVMGIVGAACGDDDDAGGGSGGDGGGDSSSDRGQEYVGAFVAASDEEDSDFSQEEIECLSRALVDVIGVDQLEAAGTPEEISQAEDSPLSELGITLDEEQGDRLWDEIGNCVDFRQLFLDQATENAPAEAVECVDNAVDDDLLKRLFLTSITEGDEGLENDEQLTQELEAVGTECAEAFQGT